jgi:hypothetical protein
MRFELVERGLVALVLLLVNYCECQQVTFLGNMRVRYTNSGTSTQFSLSTLFTNTSGIKTTGIWIAMGLNTAQEMVKKF